MIKKIFTTGVLAFLLFSTTSCNRENDLQANNVGVSAVSGANMAKLSGISDNSEYISQIIGSVKESVVYIKENDGKNLTQEEINNYLIDRFKVNNLKFSIDNPSKLNLSAEFYNQAQVIANPLLFDSEFDYFEFLESKSSEILRGDFNSDEKQILLSEIDFQYQLVQMMSSLEEQYNPEQGLAKKKSWWQSWGKCTAGILGGAVTGAGTLGLAGAAVGTVALPVVGTVSAGAVGAIAGAIGGGLTGAVASCG